MGASSRVTSPRATSFLLTQAPAGTTTIITNPAYRSAQRFAEHAIDLAPDVFLLLRLCFLESVRRTICSSAAGFTPSTFFAADCRACIALVGMAGPHRAPSVSAGSTGAAVSAVDPLS